MMNVEAEALPPDTTPLDFLKLIYRSPEVPLSVRMRAAIEAAPFIHPKLSVTAQIGSEDFAAAMERARRRSAKVLEPSPKKIASPSDRRL
jgi:hypothetical protein